MQILPLVTSRTQAAADAGLLQTTALANRQAALFSSLLDNAQAPASDTGASAAISSADASTDATSSAAATTTQTTTTTQTPSRQQMMNMLMTREDLSALHDELQSQGFSDEELSAMQDRVDSPTGMTWGQMLDEVKKKVSKTESKEKKDISNDDKVQLLGLFGKLGFTTDQSQKMVDSLSRGETRSVMRAIDAKLGAMSKDTTVSLTPSEIATLGRNMNLSEEAQKRLSSLVAQSSSAASGLSGQGLTTVMALVKNEIIQQLGKENQSLAEFRQAASTQMDKAWQRQSGKLNAGLHQDDVARKAAQVVAMNTAKDFSPRGVPTASHPGVNVLADVPQQASQTASQTTGQTAANAHAAGTAAIVSGASAHAAGTDQAAAVAGQTSDKSAATPQDSGTAMMHARVADKTAGNALQFTGTGTNSNGSSTGQQQGSGTGGFFDQAGREGGWSEFWSKVRSESTSSLQTASATGKGTTAQTLAAMDAVTGSLTGKTNATFNAALASRAARQLETGILRNVGQGAKQLTLKLSPDELGKLSVTLTVKDKEVRAVISADNADTAAMLNEQAAKIKQSLENQGLKVTQLDVRTGIAQDNQNAWQSPEQHNMAREQREAMERMRSTLRLAKDGGLSYDAGDAELLSPISATRTEGLDLFA